LSKEKQLTNVILGFLFSIQLKKLFFYLSFFFVCLETAIN